VIADLSLAYLVTEYADENLAAVLAERALTSEEALELVQPIADVLEYLHGAQLVHGNLKPSNVFAVKDRVKVSCDTISHGDPAADMLALSKTMVHALTHRNLMTQSGPDNASVEMLPQPFREIARNCSFAEPQCRWSSAEVAAWLRSGQRPAAISSVSVARVSSTAGRKPWVGFFAVFALILVAVIVGGLVMRHSGVPSAPTTMPEPVPLAPRSVPQPASTERAAAKPVNPIPSESKSGSDRAMLARGEILHQVLPEIPAKARRTVHGTATVIVKVAVDPSGNVTDAKVERGGSRYFSKLALAAARKWRFSSIESVGRREWVLTFEITKTAINVTPKEHSTSKWHSSKDR